VKKINNHTLDLNKIEELKMLHANYLQNYEKFQREYRRNMKGVESEKKGDIEDAIALYELNVNDNFEGLFPYERLAIIYTKYQLIEEARRVLWAGIDNVLSDSHKCKLRKRLIKITP